MPGCKRGEVQAWPGPQGFRRRQASKAATEDNLDVKLHYPPGSAVIFDARTLHKGATLRQANHEGLLHRPHRFTISLTLVF